MRHILLASLALAATTTAATPALAQQGPAPGVPTTIEGQRQAPPQQADLTLTIGFAPVLSPAWQGSTDYALSIFPDIRLNYKDDLFFSVPDGLGWNAVNRNNWKIGPLAKLRFGRNEDNGGSPFLIAGGSDALQGMGDVDLALEFGGFVQKGFVNNQLRARAEVRQGTGGHEGVVADTNLSWNGMKRDRSLLYSAGVRATWASSDYTNAYFGVNALQSAATGLAPFRTGSGLVSAGVNASLTKPLGRFGRDGAVTLFTSYDRLGDVVADSTLIRERGERNQFTLGLAYGYRFGL
ncbi:MipA/OmpV family protein [Erythrobacter sp. T5W1-R]|uniref:MipA/OmpV family protein n=1 Tax=Erythrobacter sp. T5W1-R TaxID=3101752 RepID=UPI002AFDED02|nr:MipA/OmpV family protein [Erythrobacter sp. T5W1-R]MEA1619780.1 MipA/OmpV family protein [Erythrobacter sp. T5W1-R]